MFLIKQRFEVGQLLGQAKAQQAFGTEATLGVR
jgi:hypothetical protein